MPALAAVGVALCLCQGCARSGPSQAPQAGSSVATTRQLPFHPPVDAAGGQAGANADESAEAQALPNAKQGSAIPFRAGVYAVLPTGTLLTVRLETPLSTTNVRAGDTFAATMASPVVIEGDTLIASGAAVTGRVESAESDSDSGYFRLTLRTITVGGEQFALRTSNLFARAMVHSPGVSSIASSGTVTLNREAYRVRKGRQLTFRLTSPVTLEESGASLAEQSRGAGTNPGPRIYFPK